MPFVSTALRIALIGAVQFSAANAQTDPYYDFDGTSNLAFAVLEQANAVSFRRNRELCGYIGLNTSGRLEATKPAVGKPSECFADDPPYDWVLVASYHTHGAFSADAMTETPSPSDIIADRDEEVSGFVSTPGGRFWYVDGEAEVTELICENCLPVDPAFKELDQIQDFYTLRELEAE